MTTRFVNESRRCVACWAFEGPGAQPVCLHRTTNWETLIENLLIKPRLQQRIFRLIWNSVFEESGANDCLGDLRKQILLHNRKRTGILSTFLVCILEINRWGIIQSESEALTIISHVWAYTITCEEI